MPITDYYNPIWDTARLALPDRIFEDEHVIIASTFECGNGYRIQRLDNGRYAIHIEPEPGDHFFSGSGCYFCFAVLNKHDTSTEHTFEVIAADAAWIRGKEDDITAWENDHPGDVPPQSYAGSSRYAIVRRGEDWCHVPDTQMVPGADHHAIAFTNELPPMSASDPLLFFSNYHWHPYTEMTAYLKQRAERHPHLILKSLCKSIEGRDVWAIELGNDEPGAPVIVCAATPQPNEMGNWACRATLDFLLSGTPEAEAVLSRHRVCLVPHPNPDGTVRGTIASDALAKFVFFNGKNTIAGDPEAPAEQVALWRYMQDNQPWLFIEWHSNHWHWRSGHTLIRYEPDLAEDPAIRRIWTAWDRRLDALPDTCNEEVGLTSRTHGSTQSLGLGVATEWGGIPAMLKVHDKFPIEQTLSFTIACFRAATDAYAEERG